MNKIAKTAGFMLLAVSMLQLTNVSAASAASMLKAGQALSHDQMLTSNDGRFILKMQWDGDLVLYQNGSRIWHSDTKGDNYAGRYAEVLWLNGGMLAVTDAGNTRVFWHADTTAWMDAYYRPPWIYPTGLTGDTLNVQDDGNVVLYDTFDFTTGDTTWRPVWASNTGGR